MNRLELTDIIKLAKLDDKEKLRIAADLMLEVALSLPHPAGREDAKLLDYVQGKIRKIG